MSTEHSDGACHATTHGVLSLRPHPLFHMCRCVTCIYLHGGLTEALGGAVLAVEVLHALGHAVRDLVLVVQRLGLSLPHNTGSKAGDFGTARKMERNKLVSHLVQRRLARGHELVEDAVLLGGVVRVTRRRARLKKVRYE